MKVLVSFLLFSFSAAASELNFWGEDKSPWDLGFGLVTGVQSSHGNSDTTVFALAGFEGRVVRRVNFWGHDWSFGVFTLGNWSAEKDRTIDVETLQVSGDFVTRQASYGPEARVYWGEETRRFLQLRFHWVNTNFAESDDAVVNGSLSLDEDMFLRGYGASLGYGQIFSDHWYWQLAYQWTTYEQGIIVVREEAISSTRFDGGLPDRIYQQQVLLSVGVRSFF